LPEWLVEELRARLNAALGRGFYVAQERPLTCADSEPEPDLAVLRGTRANYREHHPRTAELVIEVSVHTLQRDRAKARIYAAAGVKEYWLVEPEAGTITRYLQPTSAGYAQMTTHQAAEAVRSEAFPALVVSLADLLA
jgi:Uma2 family endonuclease